MSSSMPALCIFGDGEMSGVVQSMVRSWKMEITNVLSGDDLRNGWPRKKGDLKGADVGLDFSAPEAVPKNVRKAVSLGLPLVVGTTGWQDQVDEVEATVLNGDGSLLYAPNFSYALSVLVYVLKRAALLFEGEEFDPFIWEKHHTSKGDSTSGTALYIGEILLDALEHKDLLHVGSGAGRIAQNQLSVASIRAGSDPGQHTVGFDGSNETLEFVHTVRDRTAFAAGAIRAAFWLKGRKGIFTMEDLVKDMVEKAEERKSERQRED